MSKDQNIPELMSATFKFTQDAHCSSSEEFEELTIECTSALGIDTDGGSFYVLKTKKIGR
jgi:hypothetical protein